MRFRIDVYTATGATPIGGPLTEVLGLSITEKLNEIGEASITIPAHVAASRGLQRGYRYRIYHETLGYLGEFKHIESAIDANAETIAIKAYDSLIALAERVAGFRRNYSNQSFSTVATNLYNTSLGWTVSYEGATLTDAITFSVEGENYLRAADYLRRYVRGWFRRQGDTEIRFGKFSSTTPVLTFVAAKNALGQLPSTQALITQLTRTRQGGEVVNRVYPVGAGIGETKLDLRYSNRTTPYTVQNTTIATGAATAYYLEDSSSVTTYGRVERVIAWNEIRPITNSAADLQNAANALYDIASAYLQKYRTENDAYTLSAVGVPSTLRVGDLVRVAYNGVAELETGRVGWLNVASNFFVTSITRNFDAGGEATSTIGIAANGEAVIGDTEVLYDILQDVQTLKLRTQPSQTYFTKASPTMPLDNAGTATATFSFYIGAEVLTLNQFAVEFELAPLRAFATGAANGGGTTVTSGGGGATTVTSGNGSVTTVTSGGGGGTTVTSAGSVFGHAHVVPVSFAATLPIYAVYVDTGVNPPRFYANSGADRFVETSFESAHQHNVTLSNHTHDVTFGSHTHNVTLSNHDHSVTVANHTHGLTYGVNTDSVNPTITMTVNGTSVTNITKLSGSGSTTGTAATGPGVFRADILSILTAAEFRNTTHNIVFTCTGNRGTVFAQLMSRVTIQPIAV